MNENSMIDYEKMIEDMQTDTIFSVHYPAGTIEFFLKQSKDGYAYIERFDDDGWVKRSQEGLPIYSVINTVTIDVIDHGLACTEVLIALCSKNEI
jgi:hypothetical protein